MGSHWMRSRWMRISEVCSWHTAGIEQGDVTDLKQFGEPPWAASTAEFRHGAWHLLPPCALTKSVDFGANHVCRDCVASSHTCTALCKQPRKIAEVCILRRLPHAVAIGQAAQPCRAAWPSSSAPLLPGTFTAQELDPQHT